MGKKLFIIHPWDFELNSARIKSKKGKSFVKQKEEKSHWCKKCFGKPHEKMDLGNEFFAKCS